MTSIQNSVTVLLILVLLFGCAGISNAQKVQETKDWSLFFSAGTAQYDGDYGSEVFKFNRSQSAVIGLGISKKISKSFSVDAGFNYAKLNYQSILLRDGDERIPPSTATSFSTNFSSISTNFKLLDSGKTVFPFLPFKPFVESGFFVGRTNNQYNEPQFQRGLHAGVGFTQKLNNKLSLDLGLRYNWFLFDKNAMDAIEGFGASFELDKADQDEFLATTITIRKKIGGKKSQQKVTPALNALDSDNDGLTDIYDECPTVAGEIETNGCPDNDKDGIANAIDVCIDVAGTSSANGCPDKDFDGVTDLFDDCPTIAGNTLSGCLDTDLDGTLDTEDFCPAAAGFSSLNGCVSDTLYFKIDSYEIDETTQNVLRSLVNEVTSKDHRTKPIEIRIDGYTDSTGSSSYNQLLSEQRALSVALIIKQTPSFSKEKIRLHTFFFGESNPIKSNQSETDRAKNRRVILTITTTNK
jgi:outer membrane protein OmpA-like peptidoglycan-associated protein/opacity protein-like surface antigen